MILDILTVIIAASAGFVAHGILMSPEQEETVIDDPVMDFLLDHPRLSLIADGKCNWCILPNTASVTELTPLDWHPCPWEAVRAYVKLHG